MYAGNKLLFTFLLLPFRSLIPPSNFSSPPQNCVCNFFFFAVESSI